jgi:hypothetical protein
VVAGLSQRFAVQIRHLVGTDHDRLRMSLRHRACLGLCQAARQWVRPFTGQREFVDVRRFHRERQMQPVQQFAAVDGSRAQHQGAPG